MIRRHNNQFVFGLALVCGFSALMHELLWTRRLIDLLGASTESSSRVFGFFFLGLALGSAVAASRMPRVERPWRAVALAELGIAALALPMLLLPQWSDWIWPALGMERLVQWPGILIKTIISAIVILPPAFCMGLVLPIMIHGMLCRTNALETDGVRLYAINTLGGALGLLVVVLCLLPSFGAVLSMIFAMALNLLAAAGAFVLDVQLTSRSSTEEPTRGVDLPNTKAFPRALLLVAFISGAGILAAEVVATRMFMLVATLSFFAPAAILFSVISLLALGAFLAPRLRRRGPGTAGLSLIAGVIGIVAFLLAAGPLIFMGIVKHVDLLEMNGSVSAFFIKLTLLVFVSLGPAFLLAGLVFPLTISCLADAGDVEGKKLGWLLAASGLGGVVGAEAGYRILLPLFDVHTALGVVAIGYALSGLALSLRGRPRFSLIASHAGVVAAVALVTLLGLRTLPLVSKRFGSTLLDHHSGREGSVAVIVENDGIGRCIVMDNQYLLGGTSMRAFEERQANLPLLLHPGPADVAFIGLATGITPGAALLHSNLNSVTVVELSPQIKQAADKYFGEFNHHITQSRRATMIIDDGRTVIASAPSRFDVVIGDLFLPWAPGEARLYSLEHFRAVRRSLRPGGMFCQWLAMYQLTPDQFRIIAETFRAVFPHTHLFCNTLDSQRPALALVGFHDGQDLNWTTIAGRCGSMQTNSLSSDAWLRDPTNLATLYLGEWKPRSPGDSVALNTLGNLRIELDTGRVRLTVGPATKYLYARRWLEFCRQQRTQLAADVLPPDSPLTPSALQRADNLMREIFLRQASVQSR